MIRVSYWESKLATFIEERRYMPFQWGVNDCCLFGADAVKRITDYDLAEAFRGKYHTAFGAMRQIVESGARDVESLVELLECVYFPSQSLLLTRRGDLVTTELTKETGSALGMCLGANSAFVGKDGLVFVETLQCHKSWRI